jgi:plastocyanin
VFFGIWMDWSVAKKHHFVYQVNDFQTANLVVKPGDTISLVPQKGSIGSTVQMQFNPPPGPCTSASPSNNCIIASDALPGSYFFTCGEDFSCPDPGIQQSPTGGGNVYFLRTVRVDFVHLLHLFGRSPTPPEKANSGNEIVSRASAAAPAPLAQVACPDGKTTIMQNRNGDNMTNFQASVGQEIFWISNETFSISSSSPANFCSNGNGNPDGTFTPQNGNSAQQECVVNANGPTLTYKVQGESNGVLCSVIPATVTTPPATKK